MASFIESLTDESESDLSRIVLKLATGKRKSFQLYIQTDFGSARGRVNPAVLQQMKKGAIIEDLPRNVVYDTLKKKFIKSVSPELREVFKEKPSFEVIGGANLYRYVSGLSSEYENAISKKYESGESSFYWKKKLLRKDGYSKYYIVNEDGGVIEDLDTDEKKEKYGITSNEAIGFRLPKVQWLDSKEKEEGFIYNEEGEVVRLMIVDELDDEEVVEMLGSGLHHTGGDELKSIVEWMNSLEEIAIEEEETTRVYNKRVDKLLKERPATLRLPNSQVINLDTREFEDRDLYFDKGSSKMKEAPAKDGYVREPNNFIIEKVEKKPPAGATIAGVQRLYQEPKYQNQRASVFQQYDFLLDAPNNWEELQASVAENYQNDFSDADKTRPNAYVLLSFGGVSGGAEFRLFPIDVMMSEGLEFMIDNYQLQEESGYGGSDKQTIDGQSVVQMANLDLNFYRIILSGTPEGGGRGKTNNTGTKSRYWFLDQIKTKNNQCLDGAIKRFLGMKEWVNSIRELITFVNSSIKMDSMIPITMLPTYEKQFNININVYVDRPHIKNGKVDFNLLRKSKAGYEKTMNVLLKDSHYSLIVKPKKVMREISRPDCRILGLNKDGQASVLKIMEKAVAKEQGIDTKNLKEIAVIFDNETIFDRQDENFLKVYGVSWFCWDFNEQFNYLDGYERITTTEGALENKYHNEPYCYYKRGENCIDELIRFLLNPPAGIVYRPMGFNNSRFDNYSLCESAMKFRVLEDLFLADGSILYTKIRGIRNVWDASRFLVGQSLAGACKNYGTCPQKAVDLIDHYEIQCYYEYNGWDGLTDLLDKKSDLVLYNKIDCICLVSLIQKMRGAYVELFDEDIFDNLTISSMGYKICSETWSGKKERLRELIVQYNLQDTPWAEVDGATKKMIAEDIKGMKPKYNISKALCYEDDLFHRASMFAGRTQSFYGKLDIKMPIAMCDVKSLYPTVMGSYAEECPMPYGMYEKTTTFKPNRLGIYRCRIKHQRCHWKGHSRMMEAFSRVKAETGHDLARVFAPVVIARRTDDAPLDWYHRGEMDVVLTSVDIKMLRWATEDDDCVEVFEGHYWKDSRCCLFKDFLEPAKQEKTNQDRLKAEGSPLYNQAKREGCKMISNSLSGKLLEAIHENVSKIFSIDNYCEMEQDEQITQLQIQDFGCGFSMINGKKSARAVFDDPKNTNDKKKPAYIGMFIYSYARKLMYEKLLCRYLVMYMDTDSACMPLFEWERCCAENSNNGLIDTGEYGCLEEEVCATDKTGKFIPANRLIGISPKNYAVINDKADEILLENGKKPISKRKFKGVRKNDYWLPLSHFGEYTINKETGRAEGEAVDKIRGKKLKGQCEIKAYSQEQIRAMREFKCCCDCVNDVVLNRSKPCMRCLTMKKQMKKTYTNEMFEELVQGKKIVVFASMIAKIKYRIGDSKSSDYIEKLSNDFSVEEMEAMIQNDEVVGMPLEYTISHRNLELWKKAKRDFKEQNPTLGHKELKEQFVFFFQRFRKVKSEREIKDCFKLKQRFMLKII